ncbi:MAG TPA: Crp/Fnr family transcriptional regulator [Candidatus Bariatricus faecipullorum]|nr:Crp/Fnr family transcriptional regulator [Candidatus Bariatricus faecipullorum]
MYNDTKKALAIIFSRTYNMRNPCESLRDCTSEYHLINYQKGETIICQNDPVKYTYFLLSGRACVLNHISFDSDNVVDFLEPLDVMGLVEFLNGMKAYTAYVVAKEKSAVFRLPLNVFVKIIQEDASLCYQTLLSVGESLKSNMDRAETNQLFRSRDILGHYLFLQAQRKLPYVCPLTRKSLAENLHINLRTLYRHLSSFEETGCLELRRGKIVIEGEHFERLSERYGDVIL